MYMPYLEITIAQIGLLFELNPIQMSSPYAYKEIDLQKINLRKLKKLA